MDAIDVLKQAASNAGIPITHIGVAMGKRPNYVSATATRNSTPKADTLARMLDVCGYGLYAIPYEDAPKDALQITAVGDDTEQLGR